MVVWLRYHQPFAQMWSLCSLFLLFSLQSSLTFIEIQYCTTGVKALACHRTSECHSFYHSHGYKSHSYWYVPLILWQGTLEGHCVIVSFINICSCISTCCSVYPWRAMSIPKSPLPIGDLSWAPIILVVPWAHMSPHPKQHHDQFIRFCRAC